MKANLYDGGILWRPTLMLLFICHLLFTASMNLASFQDITCRLFRDVKNPSSMFLEGILSIFNLLECRSF